jgi:hypothetical protein
MHRAAGPGHRDGDRTRRLFQGNLTRKIAAAGASGRQVNRAADGRVPGKRDFGRGQESPDLRVMRRIGRALDEDRLGQIELPRDPLHLRGCQIVDIFDDGQRIARTGPVGEHGSGRSTISGRRPSGDIPEKISPCASSRSR